MALQRKEEAGGVERGRKIVMAGCWEQHCAVMPGPPHGVQIKEFTPLVYSLFACKGWTVYALIQHI